MRIRERIEWFGQVAIRLFILASVAFLSAITAMRFAIQGREVVMPDLIGKKLADAQVICQARDLGIRVEDRIYSKQPVDTVVRQSPPGEMRVKVGQFAHIVLSLGPQQVTIPALAQLSLRAARIELLRAGMQTGELTEIYLPDVAPDTVLQQDPASGTTDATSPHVDLLASLGPRPISYVMPDLAGLTLTEAEQKLASAGLKISKMTLLPLTGAPLGTVTSQLPPRGLRIDTGSSIELQVAE